MLKQDRDKIRKLCETLDTPKHGYRAPLYLQEAFALLDTCDAQEVRIAALEETLEMCKRTDLAFKKLCEDEAEALRFELSEVRAGRDP